MKQTLPSDRLREARKSAGFASAAEAARRIGVSPITYTAHENGSRDYDRKACLNYAKRFHVSPAWLMFGSEAAGPDPKSTGDIPLVDFTPGATDRTAKLLPEYPVLDEGVISDYTVDSFSLPTAIVENYISANPTDLFAMEWRPNLRGSGHSCFEVGEFLLVSCKQSRVPRGEHYLVADDIFPDIFAIELQGREENGSFIARARSATGSDKEVVKPLAEMRILGQVVGKIQRHQSY